MYRPHLEIRHIEDWPTDDEGQLRPLEEAHDFYIKCKF